LFFIYKNLDAEIIDIFLILSIGSQPNSVFLAENYNNKKC